MCKEKELSLKISAEIGYDPDRGVTFIELIIPTTFPQSVSQTITDETRSGAEILGEFNRFMGTFIHELYEKKLAEMAEESAATNLEVDRGKWA